VLGPDFTGFCSQGFPEGCRRRSGECDCHYLDGNQKAKRIIDMTRELLGLLGIDNNRLALEWVSSAEAGRFTEIVTSFTQKIKDLGKNPLGVAA